jgi:transposase InsO family protein
VKYAFIEQHRTTFPLAVLCKALQVSRSGFYAWRSRKLSTRALADKALVQEIRRVHREHRGACGALKTWRILQQEGVDAGKHRVARLRQKEGIEAVRKQRFRVTTEHHHTPAAAPDLLNRHFHAPAPNQTWVGDMTFIRTREGWLHLAILLDLFSRKIVGWSMGPQPDQKLALAALNMALAHRRPPPGLVHHTDRGAVYSGRDYRERIASIQGLPSMSGRKSAYDNAVAESFFSNLKNEVVHHCDFQTRDHARAAVFDYIELYYNRKRLHQSLGYRTPDSFERESRSA